MRLAPDLHKTSGALRVPLHLCQNRNRPLANDNYYNELIAGLYHQSGFSSHLHNCSKHIRARGLLAAISGSGGESD